MMMIGGALARCAPCVASVSAAHRNGLSLQLRQPRTVWKLQVPVTKMQARSSAGQPEEQALPALSKKKCVPCEAGSLRPMRRELAEKLLPQVPGWELVEDSKDSALCLHRAWKSKTFLKGLELFKHVAEVAEEQGHHPDLHLVGWNKVSIDISTHAVGGLTENDFILAAKINELNVDHLLRRSSVAAQPASSG